MSLVGITGYGVYLPRRRLCRTTVAESLAWLAPNLKAEGKGRRTVASWDEDTITMAVEAARICRGAAEGADAIGALYFASTTPVFLDRLNSGVVAEALTLGDGVRAFDLVGSRRAGSGALLQAIDATSPGRDALVVASEKRLARAASVQELAYGDAAACFRIGAEGVIARLVARYALTTDFVDRYRSSGARYEYLWEERWAREEGYGKIVPRAIAQVLDAAGMQPESVNRIVMPCPFPGLATKLAEDAGIRAAAPGQNLGATCGDLGTANALTMLADALDSASAGERILVIDFGQGCEAYVLETTAAIAQRRPRVSLSDRIAAGATETNYLRHLTMRGLIDWEKGPKAERDTRTSLSTLYRNRAALLGFVGGRNPRTGDIQFPPSRMALGETGHAVDQLEPYKFSEKIGTVLSWSADRMALTPDPPNYYGMITFPEGGRLMMDFTDILDVEVTTGMQMRMTFRIKEVDVPRDYTRYFWKATPLLTKSGT